MDPQDSTKDIQEESPRLIGRTLGGLRRAWKGFTGAARVRLTGTVRPDLPQDDLERLRQHMQECVEARGGEVSARARAADLGRTYLALNDTGRQRFLKLLAQDYGVDNAALTASIESWSDIQQRDREGENVGSLRRASEAALRDVLTPPRTRMLAQFNALPEGVKFLVSMREELIPLAQKDPILKGLDDDLKGLLSSWFDVGFLDLRCITWDAPASLLEKLAQYEAVHAVRSWTDIKNRLAPDRRCYAFFHPQMPDEPLIYVWVALVRGMSENVQKLLDVKAPTGDPTEADTAIFYSISNAQRGLAGISFGSFLIKRVVEDLAGDFKSLKTFATLSPIPGFHGWLDDRIAVEGPALLSPQEQRALSQALAKGTPEETVKALSNHRTWYRKPDLEDAARAPLLRLCAVYLTQAKRGDFARDRVAHFHLSNGARIERINWLGDTSPKGLRQSAGMMINYLYRSSDIEKNHEAYRGDGKIRSSSTIRGLLKV